jgi:hypothetical protein
VKNDPHVTHHNATICPTCGYVMNAAATVDGSPGRPEPGDITGCMACGQPLVYEQHMQVRLMTQAEYDALEPAARRDLAKIRAFAKTGWHR